MKFILVLILTASANAFAAQWGDEAAEGGPTATEAVSGAVEAACKGSCDIYHSQTLLTTSPYQENEKVNAILKGRGVVTPEQYQNGKALQEKKLKEEGLDM